MVNAKLNAQRERDGRRAIRLVIGLSVAVVTVIVGMLVYGEAEERLFSANPTFTLRKLEVRTGRVVPADLVKEYTRLQEGMNLFGMDIGRIRTDFLEKTPGARGIEITRDLPDRMIVTVTERVPLAVIGMNGFLVTDREGVMFVMRSGTREMPVIKGFGGTAVKPGGRLRGMATAALQVLEACSNPDLGLELSEVDITNREYLLLKVADGKDGKMVRLSWDKMEETTAESKQNMMVKLRTLSQAMQARESQTLSRMDVTYEDRIYGR
jgi:cell division septal protein FtsQ